MPLDAELRDELAAHIDAYCAVPAQTKTDALTDLALDPPVFTHESWRTVSKSALAGVASQLREQAKPKAMGKPMSVERRSALLAEAAALEAVKVYGDVPRKYRETGLLDLSRFHRTVWHPALLAAGVEPSQVHLHDARGFVGTNYSSAGASLKETMTLLGHDSPDAALRYQRTADLDRHRELAEALSNRTKIT